MGHRIQNLILISLAVFALTAQAELEDCPQIDGVFSRSQGHFRGVMAFGITNQNKLFLVNETTGIQGAHFEIDGRKRIQKLSDREVVTYSAICQRGILTLQGTKGDKEFRFVITDEDGGKIYVFNGERESVYEKTWRVVTR